MASGIVSGVYQYLLFGMKLSSMGMGGKYKHGLSQSTRKGLLNQS